MFGVLGAFLSIYHPEKWRKNSRTLLVLGLGTLIVDKFAMETSSIYRNYLNFTVVSLGTLLTLPALSRLQAPRHRVFRLFGFISTISYSMYLLNLSPVKNLILSGLIDALPTTYAHAAIVYAAYWGITIGLSYILYRSVEKPFLKLRNHHTRHENLQSA